MRHNPAQLPDRTQRFLDHGAPEGQRSAEAFAAAVQLRDNDYSEADAMSLIESGAAKCGLPAVEARNAVKSAYKRPAREPIHAKGNGSTPDRKSTRLNSS